MVIVSFPDPVLSVIVSHNDIMFQTEAFAARLAAGLFLPLDLESSVLLFRGRDRRRIRLDPALYPPGNGPHLE